MVKMFRFVGGPRTSQYFYGLIDVKLAFCRFLFVAIHEHEVDEFNSHEGAKLLVVDALNRAFNTRFNNNIFGNTAS